MSSDLIEEEGLYLEDLLDTDKVVSVKVLATSPGVEVPQHLKKRLFFYINVSWDLVPDLDLLESGFCGTFFFKRLKYFCFIPWEAVEGYGGEAVIAFLDEQKTTNLSLIQGEGQESSDRKDPPKLRVVK